MNPKEITREEVINRLKKSGNNLVSKIKTNKNPDLEIPLRTLSNVYFDAADHLIKLGDKTQKRMFFNVNQARKFMQTTLVAAQIKELLEQNKPALSTRQLYYILKHNIPGTKENTFDDQSKESDPVIEDIEVIIDVLREELNLVAVPKGVMSGPLIVEDRGSGDTLDYTKMGTAGGAIPPSVEDEKFHIKECSADFVLVVEKFAVWNLLNQEKFWKRHNCILMTGKGQPARAERRLLARFGKETKIPIYCFCDMDVWGYYIYSVYKQGSINLAFFSQKAACPRAKYIGLMTKDIKYFDIPKTSWIKLNEGDYARLKEVANYEWFKKPEWQKELTALKEFGYKVESDALVAKNIDFTAKKYLPQKIESKDFLD